MAKQTISIGTTANDATGDRLRTAFTKVNSNFTELYANTTLNATAALEGLDPVDNVNVDNNTTLDLTKKVQYLDGGVSSNFVGYYLPDGYEGQLMHFVAYARENMHQIAVYCDNMRFRGVTGIQSPGIWYPFIDDASIGAARTLGLGIFIDGAWNFDDGGVATP
jgi:hypothetical protein